MNIIKKKVKLIKSLSYTESKVKSVKEVSYDEPMYVYDVSMSNNKNRWFFGNNILVHNTDSCSADSVIETSQGTITIEELYNICESNTKVGEKEFAHDENIMVMSYDKLADEPYMGHIDYVYRHKVSKDLYEIEDEAGNVVTVTEDHSVMVERDGQLIEVKPQDITEGDIVLTLDIQ